MRHKNLELAHLQRIKLIFYYSEGFSTYFLLYLYGRVDPYAFGLNICRIMCIRLKCMVYFQLSELLS